ncbi:helix-turn-helix transcriptional regulator [uncultured Desulfuromusa sp.]|uniref:helix-turn-helix transcriptional regulator n=1 Tax=uncultured Desulfuromusa sp. TaxID=219183 RepID=UPI002AA811D3|nr:helix-turn-helix transcriptional regulator [uncultured Desulfuromusa sp.]
MDVFDAPSVAIDGNAIRKIREEKRLTQLYVAKVVGVTTDTVSRWENNRYPTIMRDNALGLAEALEVDISEILQHGDHEASEVNDPLPESKKKYWIYFLLLACFVSVALVFLFIQSGPSPVSDLQAKRILPSFAAPGSRVLIQVELSSKMPLKGMILKEKFPDGWHMSEAEPPVSHVDPETGVAKWIFRKPPLTSKVFYVLRVPDTVLPDADTTIEGELIANPEGQRSAAIVQPTGRMQIKPVHWADKNGDLVIDDVEILEVSDLTEEAKSLDLNWDLLESIWEIGSYQWDNEKQQFAAVRLPQGS